jgi:hypothetical protein
MATGIGGVDDAAFVFDEATEPDGSEVDVEEPVINLLEADAYQRMPPFALTSRVSKCPG